MSNLTEQWKKGELLEGFYYVRCAWSDEIEIRYVHNGVDDWQEIIAEVPSYEEWKASEKYNKHLEEVIKIYERKDKQATETSIAYNELEEENTKLKELLKEVQSKIRYSSPRGIETFADLDDTLLGKINQVLANNKIQANTVACNKIQENK